MRTIENIEYNLTKRRMFGYNDMLFKKRFTFCF